MKIKYKRIEKAIRDILTDNPGYGYRRIKTALEKANHKVNHKALRKLLVETKLGFFQRKNRKKRKSGIERILEELGAKVNLVKQLTQIKLFQVLFTDFTELVYAYGRKKTQLIVYLEAVSKKILGDHIGPGTSESALRLITRPENIYTNKKLA